MCVCVHLRDNWSVREGYPVGVCVCVWARLLCGLRCKRAVRTHLADKQAAGWLGNQRVFPCVCVFVFMWLSDGEKWKEKRKRAQEQAEEVKFAWLHCSLFLSDAVWHMRRETHTHPHAHRPLRTYGKKYTKTHEKAQNKQHSTISASRQNYNWLLSTNSRINVL